MIKVINHKADTLPKALLISDSNAKDICDICILYHNKLSVTHILEQIQNTFGISGMVLASHYLGQLKAETLNNFSNQNLFSKWQRVN